MTKETLKTIRKIHKYNKIRSIDPKAEEKSLKEELPLGEGVLQVNLGVPLIIVCTKSDVIQSNDKGIFNEQSLEVLYKNIRTTALLYGASTIFVSDKTQTNLELLYHYLVHRSYGYQFRYKPMLDEKDRIFVPSGFDSLTLIKYVVSPILLIAKWQRTQEHCS